MTAFPSEPLAYSSPLVELIYFDAGGGHRASATALKTVAQRQGRNWRIRMTNLRDILEPADFIRRFTGVRAEHLYNTMLKYELTVGVTPMLPLMRMLIRRMHPRNVALLTRYWTTSPADLVISMIPHFNRSIFDGLRAADRTCVRRATPMVTVMTDLADTPPHFWIERQDQYVICGTNFAVSQALAAGIDPEFIFKMSGMIVRPEFYERPALSRADERTRLGLHPDLPTALVMFGGYGSRRMLPIGRALVQSSRPLQLIFLCGHNARLREQLSSIRFPFPSYVGGFTTDVSRFMRLADFFIGKPGPGSISEALVMGLPVIVERNSATMIQERYNTEWLQQQRLGVVIHSFSAIDRAVATVLDAFPQFRARLAMHSNRAVFEVPAFLDQVLQSPPAHRLQMLRLGA